MHPNKARFLLLLSLGLLLGACGSDQPETAVTLKLDQAHKPLTIGVVTDQDDLWQAIKRAHELYPSCQGRPVRLKLSRGDDLYQSAQKISPSAEALIVAGQPRRSAEFLSLDKPVYFSVPLELTGETRLRSSSLAAGELAGRTAGFILKEFKPDRVAVALDQASEVSTHMTSRLAAALTARGGRLGGIVYLDGPRSDFKNLAERLEQQDVGALGVPYAGEVTVRLIEELREQRCRIPIVVINPPDETALGSRWRHRRERLYIVSQFAAEQAGAGRAQAYRAACVETDQALSSAEALAVDSYFMALDAGASLPGDYLRGQTAAQPAQGECYVYRVKGRKRELVEVLKPE